MWSRQIKKLHFVGIGGAGMSGIAEILAANGFVITGSDMAASETTEHLAKIGIRVAIGHDAVHIGDTDVVVISSAVTEDNAEVRAARATGKPVIRRAEMLGELMRLKFSIGVAGTHGKTTTTSMIGHIFTKAGLDPTVIVGGRLVHLDSNARLGDSEYLVAEADEFDRSFLCLHPTVALATNLEEDHLDCYRDLADLQDNFVEFFRRVPFYGSVLLNAASPALVTLAPRIDRRLRTFALDAEADIVGRNIEISARATRFEVLCDGDVLGDIALPLPGRHNAENALAACAAALETNVPFAAIAAALESFATVARRFEIKGDCGGITVVDDYAHHPTEVRAALAAGRGWLEGKGRLIAVFQPHLFSRTRQFYRDFADALSGADVVMLAPIYPAREKPIPGVTSGLIADAVQVSGPCTVLGDLDEVAPAVAAEAREGDLVMTIGAGSIYRAGPQILAMLKAAEVTTS